MDFRFVKTGAVIALVMVAIGCNESRESTEELEQSGVERALSASLTTPPESTRAVEPVASKLEESVTPARGEEEKDPNSNAVVSSPNGFERLGSVASEANLVETGGLALSELVIAKGIENRRPVQPGTAFEADSFERIYVFLKVDNPARTEDEVVVSWVPEGSEKERGTVRVSVGAQPKWRTWAFTRTVKKPGKYRVLVRNADEEILATAPFEITESI